MEQYRTQKTHLTLGERPQENWPSLHLVMIVEIPGLKILIGVTSFCSC